MMSDFKRHDVGRWHQEVPGARWFKADLHIHTLDDLPGRRVKVPPGVTGDPSSDENIRAYARVLLQAAVQRGVGVLALTPHSARIAPTGDASAVWGIVDEWNDGVDDDGEPFRSKVYAVFPGFEPSLGQGKSGVHLLFLFDPEIGRANYLRAFDLVMDQRSPWKQNELQLSGKTAKQAFAGLRDFHREHGVADGSSAWDYLVLAPHVDNDKGIFGAQKGQILAEFPKMEIAGLELPDEKLSDEYLSKKPWLREDLERHPRAFFHGSDAYSVGDIGRRFTWVKLARPRIEGLRQAFLAADSRIRPAYRRAAGKLVEIDDPPDVTISQRPWLKSVCIAGQASFFRTKDSGQETRFNLSPDLTCIIGGSMTGKSTLLDGLRVHVGAPLPTDAPLKRQVLARGEDSFLAGSAAVSLECPGQDPTGAAHDRWPAVFYAQNELQRLAQDANAVEDILSRLVAEETSGIRSRTRHLKEMDEKLLRLSKRLEKLDQDFADAEQGADRARRAAMELDAFAAAGIDELHHASASHSRWRRAAESAETALADAKGVAIADLPEDLDSLPLVAPAVAREVRDPIYKRIAEVREHMSLVTQGLADVHAQMSAAVLVVEQHEATVRARVERKLAADGFDGTAIKEFSSLNRQAALLESREALLQELQEKRKRDQGDFAGLLDERAAVVREQRQAFDRVMAAIHDEFGGRIRACRKDQGIQAPLDAFLGDLKQRGITRWWNELKGDNRPSPQELLDGLQTGGLDALGMSATVQQTFRDAMPSAQQRALATIRCADRYSLELKVGDEYRRLDDLSGGQRVSVLLSLLLETTDQRPLVVDQPEDELDNHFLFDTVLPALKRLKGRRQIIVATHNPNIVVNGDADQVIQLEATANNGSIAQAGAIEDAAVRRAIMRTVDGGDEAFRLRHMKYGF